MSSPPRTSTQRGAASVEHVGLCALIALLILAAVAALATKPADRSARELGEVIGRRIACAPRHPVPCGRNPLALAYGFPVGKLVRQLAPSLAELSSGGLQPVDFRRCRQPSCAAPGSRPGLTASNRRVTLFTSIEDLRAAGGLIRVTYWLYRPGHGWESVQRTGGAAEIAAAAELRLNLENDPQLIPLETLSGRNHTSFPRAEEPPWRWRISTRIPD